MIEFRADLDWYPNKEWSIIDTQLWSMALHGVNTLPNQGNPRQYTFKPKGAGRSPMGIENQFKNCLITTEEAATTPCSLSLMSVGTALHPATQPLTAHKASISPCKRPFSKITMPLQERHFIPPMPIKVNKLSEPLKYHPDSEKVNYVIQGLRNGFDLEYSGPFEPRTPANLSTADQDPQLIRDNLQKEVSLGHMIGPFPEPPFLDLICSPVGLVPKKESSDLCMIMHLSYPYGGLINDFIDPEKAATKYQSFQDAVKLVVQQGSFCWLVKGDVKSAFRVVPILFKHLWGFTLKVNIM